MAWTAPRTWVAGELVTASLMNQFVRDNQLALVGGQSQITSQAQGDVLYASSSTQLARLAADANKFLKSGASAPAWAEVSTAVTVLQKTNAYTATVADCGDNALIKVHMTSAGAGFTIGLYAASGNAGKKITIIKETGDLYPLTVDANSSETINGTTTRKLYSQFDYIAMVCDGVNWWITDEKITIAYKYTLAANQSIPTGAWTKILLDSAVQDTASAHASNCFTAPQDGYYLAIGQGYLDGYNNTTAGVACWKNGSWTNGTQSIDNNGNYTSGPAQALEFLSTGETMQLFVYQTRGVNINNLSAAQHTSLRVIYLHS